MDTINVCLPYNMQPVMHICSHPVLLFVSSVMFFFCRYNKRDFDFPSLREYNDYLEEVEDIGTRTSLELTTKGMLSTAEMISP